MKIGITLALAIVMGCLLTGCSQGKAVDGTVKVEGS